MKEKSSKAGQGKKFSFSAFFCVFFSKASFFSECPSLEEVFFLPRSMWSHLQQVVAVSGVMCAPGALAHAARALGDRVWALEHKVCAHEQRVWACEHKVWALEHRVCAHEHRV